MLETAKKVAQRTVEPQNQVTQIGTGLACEGTNEQKQPNQGNKMSKRFFVVHSDEHFHVKDRESGLYLGRAYVFGFRGDKTGERTAQTIAAALNAYYGSDSQPTKPLTEPLTEPLEEQLNKQSCTLDRAELAARFMAASISEAGFCTEGYEDYAVRPALKHADALLAATLEKEPMS